MIIKNEKNKMIKSIADFAKNIGKQHSNEICLTIFFHEPKVNPKLLKK